jgi:predicted anti-sigma-YlaC factor YlaD
LGCEETRELIDADADSELDLVSSLGVERHIQICQDCLRAHQNLQALSSLKHGESLYSRRSAGRLTDTLSHRCDNLATLTP